MPISKIDPEKSAGIQLETVDSIVRGAVHLDTYDRSDGVDPSDDSPVCETRIWLMRRRKMTVLMTLRINR